MPQIFNDAVMTNGGAALLNKAIAGDCTIQITRMALGDGTYTAEEKTILALQQRTALKSLKQSATLSSLSIETATSVKATAVFSNESLAAAYHMNEIGIFAQEYGDPSTEILYSIAVVSGDEGEIMPISNGTTPVRIIQSWIVTISNSAEVTINLLSDDAFALSADMGLLNSLDTDVKTTVVAALNWVAHNTIPLVVDKTLTNSLAYPFNDSQETVQISPNRDNSNYRVDVEVLSFTGGGVGDIEITDKLVNGFKIAYTGAATSVSVRCHVLGGMEA